MFCGYPMLLHEEVHSFSAVKCASTSIEYNLSPLNVGHVDCLQSGNIMNYIDINILVYVFDAHEYIFLLSICQGVNLMIHKECINMNLVDTSQNISKLSTQEQ